MEQKLAAAVFADVGAGRATVTEVCARVGISRDTYYRYRARFAAEGLAGLTPRSRAPLRSPTRTDAAMTGLILTARQTLKQEGWDNGALSVHARLLAEGHQPPCWRTIHRVLRREGLIEAQPGKRPRSSYKRFVFPATDDCWSIDAFAHHLADTSAVVVFEILDDHSRSNITSLAWPREDTEGAWKAMATGIDRYGRPRMLLSDCGLAFTGRYLDQRVLFEKNLAQLGIKMINTRPRHPQTNGKNERAHATARKWLAAQPTAPTLTELQTQLERYRTAYNHRPHQSLGGDTPMQRRITGARPNPPANTPLPEPTQVIEATTSTRDGWVYAQKTIIPLGAEYRELPVTVFITGDHALIFHREQLLRELTLDRTRKRQAPHHRPRPTKRRTYNYNPQP